MDDAVLTPRPPAPPAAGLDAAVLAQVLQAAPDAIAVLDCATGRYVIVNPAGERLLGRRAGERPDGDEEGAGEQPVTLVRGPLVLQVLSRPLLCRGRDLRVLHARDVTRARGYERHLAAFSATCASIAFSGPLTTVLDRLAGEVKAATGMLACTFLLMDDRGRLRQAGMADESYPGVDDYAERLERCRTLGAPLLSQEVFRERTPVIAPYWRQQTLDDQRFSPLHDISACAAWDTLAAVPVISRGRVLGVMNGFYQSGTQPGEGDVAFLTAVADLAAAAVDNARLLGTLESKVALEERHLLARELHDSVSQALFSLTLQARALELGVGSGAASGPAVASSLAAIRSLTEGALAEMRALIFQLRPAALHEEGLVAAVRNHAAAISAREGLEVVVDAVQEGLGLPPLVEEQLFRVVQEALTNATKHARAGAVRVSVRAHHPFAGSLEVEVRDDGAGFDTGREHPGHLGLESMAERIAQVGGTLRVTSSARGTSVLARVPDALDGPTVAEERLDRAGG